MISSGPEFSLFISFSGIIPRKFLGFETNNAVGIRYETFNLDRAFAFAEKVMEVGLADSILITTRK